MYFSRLPARGVCETSANEKAARSLTDHRVGPSPTVTDPPKLELIKALLDLELAHAVVVVDRHRLSVAVFEPPAIAD